MNNAFEKYNFPKSKPKKVLFPRRYENKELQRAFQLKLDFKENENSNLKK